MKKTTKSILCLLFALIFVFQFVSAAGTAAFADEDEEEEAPASVSIIVNGKSYDGPVSKSQLEGGIEFIPSDGAYVASISINGEGVTGYAIADGRSLSIDSDTVADIFADETLSEEDGSFNISAKAAEMDEGYPKSLTAPSEDKANVPEGRAFSCWKYRYDNGSIALLEPGEEFSAFMSGEFSAITYKVEAEEEPEEKHEEKELEEEAPAADGAPKELIVPLSGPVKAPAKPEDVFHVYFTVNDSSAEYTGAVIPAPSGSASFTVTKIEKNGSEVTDSAELAKYSITGVNLSLSKDDIAGEYKDIGTYAIVIPNLETIRVLHETDDISTKAYLHITEGKFEITKRALSVKADDVSKKYDGTILAGKATADALLDGHSVSGAKFVGETAAIVNKTYTLDSSKTKVEDIVVKDSANNDVTSLYDITLDGSSAASYIISAPETKTKLSAKAVDVTKDYTGSPVEGSISITGELPKDATVVATYDYKDAHTDIGSHKYALKGIAVMLDGHDISAAFDIDIDESVATLKITGHSYTITIKNATKEYDGTPLKPADCDVKGLMEGDRIYAIKLTGEQTDAGTSKSDVDLDSIVIYNAKDEDVTKAYGEPTVNQGNLTVKKLAFTLTAKDASKVYDGTALTRNEYSISGTDKAKLDKLGSWSLNVVVSGSIKEVGTAANKIGTVELKVGSNVVDSKNYEVTRVDGTLTVEADSTKPTVTITVESKSKVYDGTALLLEPDAYTISDTLPSGWSIDVTLETASITAAGSKQVTVKEYKVYQTKDNVKTLIDDPSKFPFNIALKPGTLTVTKYPITITAKSGSKYYDGKEFILNSVTITAANNKIVDGQKIEINVEAQDADGNTVKAVKVGKYYNVVTQVVIKEGNKDVTSNYDITTVNGTLTIKNSNGNPQTGDTSNISLWATVLAVSAVAVVCIVVIVLVRNKKREN